MIDQESYISNTSVKRSGHRDDIAAKTGMWLFLFTELLLFSGLILIYIVFRGNYSHEFHEAASHLNVKIGVVNTLILITSSLTIVISLAKLQRGFAHAASDYLWITIGLAGLFLMNKFVEWFEKIQHGYYPGSIFLETLPKGESLFYSLYYSLTGLHALHIIIGIIIMAFMVKQVGDGRIDRNNYVKLENAALYWHLVDIIWIVLLPLFYLTN
ncbi:MAG: cytochrome c oxidase subunit 3 family protein [Ignavibacteriae bacterium]|nr:MAG: cytochrome c oxidase subunit 3 family protein [Ignavibacteriota bacterium]